jgi:trehalose-6-phosphate synthase
LAQHRERIRQLEEKFAGKKMLLGVDRLDYVKGIPQKLQGLMYFFNKYPEWRGKVRFVLSLSPPPSPRLIIQLGLTAVPPHR